MAICFKLYLRKIVNDIQKKYWQYDNDMITYRMLSRESKSDSKGFKNKKQNKKSAWQVDAGVIRYISLTQRKQVSQTAYKASEYKALKWNEHW
mgnify:CR=1 FL=1